MKLSLKLPLSFGAVLAVVTLAALFGFWQLSAVLQTFRAEVGQATQDEREIRGMEVAFKEQVQEWKNVLLRGKDEALKKKHWSAFQKREAEVQAAGAKLLAALTALEARDLVKRFLAAHATMGKRYREGLQAFEAAEHAHDKGDSAVRGMDREPAKLLEESGAVIARLAARSSKNAVDSGRRAQWISLSIMAAMCVVGLAVGLVVSRQVARQLGGDPRDAVTAAKAISQGDLTIPLDVRLGDQDSLLAALAAMRGGIEELAVRIRTQAAEVAATSGQIANANEDLASRTEEQASALQQIAASMEELTATVQQTADNAHWRGAWPPARSSCPARAAPR